MLKDFRFLLSSARLVIFAATLSLCVLSGCLTGKEDSAETTPGWSDNVQGWNFIGAITSDQLIPNEVSRCGAESEFPPIRYRLRGDSLDLGWAFFEWTSPDTVYTGAKIAKAAATDTFWFGGTYVRHSGSSGSVLGSWGLKRHAVWQAGTISKAKEDSLRALWNFLYADEEMNIQPNLVTFAYPGIRLFPTSWAEYQDSVASEATFQYIGKDSLRVTRNGETVAMKLKPFQYFRATSSDSSRPALNVSLTDSCDFAGTVVDSTWLHEVIYGIYPSEKRPVGGEFSRGLRVRR